MKTCLPLNKYLIENEAGHQGIHELRKLLIGKE